MANRHGRQGLENSGRLLAERQLADNDPRLPGSKRPARTVQVNLAESPLGWLAARGRISRRQFDAGEQLRRDWTIACLAPRVPMRWDPAPSGGRNDRAGALDPTLGQLEAKRRFAAAITRHAAGLGAGLWGGA